MRWGRGSLVAAMAVGLALPRSAATPTGTCKYASLEPLGVQHVAVWDTSLCNDTVDTSAACVVDTQCRVLGRPWTVHWDAIGDYNGIPLNQTFMGFQGDGGAMNVDMAAFSPHVSDILMTAMNLTFPAGFVWPPSLTTLTIQNAALTTLPPVPPTVRTLFVGANGLHDHRELQALPTTVEELSLENNVFTELGDLDWRHLTKLYLLKNSRLRRISNVQLSSRLRHLNLDFLHLDDWTMDQATFSALNSTLQPNRTVPDATVAGGVAFAGYNSRGLSISSNATACTAQGGSIIELWPGPDRLHSGPRFLVCVLDDLMTRDPATTPTTSMANATAGVTIPPTTKEPAEVIVNATAGPATITLPPPSSTAVAPLSTSLPPTTTEPPVYPIDPRLNNTNATTTSPPSTPSTLPPASESPAANTTVLPALSSTPSPTPEAQLQPSSSSIKPKTAPSAKSISKQRNSTNSTSSIHAPPASLTSSQSPWPVFLMTTGVFAVFLTVLCLVRCCCGPPAYAATEMVSPQSTNYYNTPYYTPLGGQDVADVDLSCLESIRLGSNEVAVYQGPGTLLGSGAFANVGRGSCRGVPVAVKWLQNALASPRQVQSFVAEIKLLSELESPYVVTMLGACWTHPSDLKLVMELMDMGDLRRFLDLHTRHSYLWPTKCRHVHSLVQALVYLHGQNIIHRDVKSRNVLLDSRKGVKMTDFGVSKEVVAPMAMTGGIGTFRWMAPEVLQDQHYTTAADIYSFGAILSELSTHQVPHFELTRSPSGGQLLQESAILVKVVQDRIVPSFTPDCPDWVHAMALRCLSHHPADRPTATELAAIVRTRIGSPTRSSTSGRGYNTFT